MTIIKLFIDKSSYKKKGAGFAIFCTSSDMSILVQSVLFRKVFAGCLQHLRMERALNLVTTNIVTCTCSTAILNLVNIAVNN